LIAVATALPAAADTGQPVNAVWKEQHVQLTYFGRTSRYSCEGLRDKLRALLAALGARRDMKLVALGCADFGAHLFAARSVPSVSIVFSSPALPDPAAKPLRAGDPAAVEARFEPFTITSDAFRNMGVGDCELVDEFARQILPKLAVREVREDLTCIPNEVSGSRYFLRGLVLMPLPRTDR
jgi:hypothetical protein